MSRKNYLLDATFDIFTAVKIGVEVFWTVTTFSVVVGCQRFGAPCCLHLQGEDLKYLLAQSGTVLVLLHHNVYVDLRVAHT
jgi:hypothetical protein